MSRLKRLLRQDNNRLAHIKLDKNKFLQPIFEVKDIFMTEKLISLIDDLMTWET